MSLCDLCQSIPWETLPKVPQEVLRNSTGHEYIRPLMRWPEGVRGHPHHRGLDSLRQSSLSCNLCSLIYGSAANVQNQLEELRSQWEAGKIREYGCPTFELWIMKRDRGGDGCWVMSFVQNEKHADEAWIIAALGLCVRDDDPLKGVIESRPVEGSASSPIAFKRARRWLHRCDEHTSCKPLRENLPTRILDVGEHESQRIHLIEPVPEATVGKYVTLSYCWGASQEFTTTRVTMEERKGGINVTDMPKTFQDIVELTRELGLRYLWVDSLCICQDEHADWERESAKILSIYSNAYLTVAAARASNSSDGFLGPRKERIFVGLDYTRAGIRGKALVFALPLKEEHIKHEYITLSKEPLSNRAWALQERALSHRSLIYSTDQMYFECNNGFHGEDGLYLEERHDSVHKRLHAEPIDPTSHFYKGLRLNERSKRDLLRGWYNLVWLYGPKKLSHASDKLPAISGIAGIYAEEIGEEYLAGLWREQLIEGLMWQGLRFRRVPEYRAPSWSWASGDGIPGSGQIVDYSEIAEVLDAKVTLKGANPFGEVTDGWVKLRAPLEQLYLITDNWDPGHLAYNNNIKVRTENGNPQGDYSRFDFDFTADDAPQEAKKIVKSLQGVDIFALVILKAGSWDENATEDEGTYHALIVKRVEGTENFQRLGFFLTGKETLGREPEKESREQFSVVTLV